MEHYGTSTYGDRIADIYDDLYEASMDTTSTVDLLAELAGKGRALELGIGTGRVALPLAARGVQVEGIDASEAMVDKLRQRPGGQDISVAMGDFTDVAVDGRFKLIYIPFTTFFALPSQDEQIRCLRNVAAHLEPDGWFVLDAFVPDLRRFHDGQVVSVRTIESGHVLLDVAQHDPVTQTIHSSHVLLSDAGIRIVPVVVRYAWPAELDAMALVAGLSLAHRYADYSRRPFEAISPRHVSIYNLHRP
ncbi:MAG TPA: class I SAM-dependent methyltransferase [Acidimicrobiia bacterium]|nr:class I SAM-dependent methyltransferase [Acidimicrobiia bacterium]